MILLTRKAGLRGPGVGERGRGGAHFHSTEGRGCACIFSFPMNVRERDFPAQLEDSGGALLVSSGAQLGGLCRQAREVIRGGLLEPEVHLLREGPSSLCPREPGRAPLIQNDSTQWEVLAEKRLQR